jgi:hypothetical protein
MSQVKERATIRYTKRVLYGTHHIVSAGHTVDAEIHDNGNAWWYAGDRQYLVYPDEFEKVGARASSSEGEVA